MKLVNLPGTNIYINPEFVVAVEEGVHPVNATSLKGKSFVTIRLSHPIVDSGYSVSDTPVAYDRLGLRLYDVSVKDIVTLLTKEDESDILNPELDALLAKTFEFDPAYEEEYETEIA